jgi:PAS domain S-box-containing protein
MRKKIFMNQMQYKVLLIWILYSFYSLTQSYGSTDRRKPAPEKPDIQNIERMADSLNSLALTVGDSSIQLSKKYSEKALILAKSIHYQKGEGHALLHLGQYYLYNNNFLASLKLNYDALAVAEKSKDVNLKTCALKRICVIFIKLKRSDKAKSFFDKSFRLAISNKDTNNIIELLVHLGEIHIVDNALKKAGIAYYQALWYSRMQKDMKKVAWVYKHIGNFYLLQEDIGTAEYYYKTAILLNHKGNYLFDLGTLYSLMSHICLLENKLAESLKYNYMALKIRQQKNQTDQVASSLLNIGNSYLLMNKQDSAFAYFRKGLDLANNINIDIIRQRGNKYFYEWYLQRKDWKNALEYYRLYTDAKDSLNFAQNREETAIFEANQFISENEKKSELLEAENQIQKTRIRLSHIQILFLVIVLLIILGILYYTHEQFLKNKKSKIALQQLNDKLDSEIDERIQIEAQLRKSEALHHFLTDNSLDVIARIDSNNKYTYISPSCVNIYGFNQDEMMNMKNVYTLVDPSSLAGLYVSYKEMIKSREPYKFTYKSLKKDGSSFWAESHINPIFDKATGEMTEMITVIRDISERVAHEQSLMESSSQKEILMREIHHRAKNNFVILISLLNLQKFQSQNRDVLEILSELQSRINTMLLIHEQLFRSNSVDTVSFGRYIMNLSTIISSAFRKEGISMHAEISECMLNIETALPLGLIVNEVLTNAYKYAFKERDRGNIHIRLVQVENYTAGGTRNWELIIEDDGVGLPESFRIDKATSTGSQIIQALAEQIHARIIINGKTGTSFRIIFPGIA